MQLRVFDFAARYTSVLSTGQQAQTARNQLQCSAMLVQTVLLTRVIAFDFGISVLYFGLSGDRFETWRVHSRREDVVQELHPA
eukprot:139211-Rhodomonas_salina.3